MPKKNPPAADPTVEEARLPVRQGIKVVGRTVYCFRCEGNKEIAVIYCA